MREIHNIWDVSEHRSLNELALVSVQAPEGLKPHRKGEAEPGAGMCAQLHLFPAGLLLPSVPSARLSLALRIKLREQQVPMLRATLAHLPCASLNPGIPGSIPSLVATEPH